LTVEYSMHEKFAWRSKNTEKVCGKYNKNTLMLTKIYWKSLCDRLKVWCQIDNNTHMLSIVYVNILKNMLRNIQEYVNVIHKKTERVCVIYWKTCCEVHKYTLMVTKIDWKSLQNIVKILKMWCEIDSNV
jgi:hypothetical protein